MDRIIGAFEKVSFPDFGLVGVVAKIDTGAASGALHATHIKEITLETGEKAINFRPYGQLPAVTVASYAVKPVRSSNGAVSMRYVIPTVIVIRKVQYPIHIGLSDRTLMMKGVLVGRQFLRKHGFIIDAKKGTKYRYEVK